MKKVFNARTVVALLALASPTILLDSCIDEQYDLKKEIDTEMTLFKNLSLPIGDVEKVYLDELLALDGTEAIFIDENGNYVFRNDNSKEPYHYVYKVPSFTFSGYSSTLHSQPITPVDLQASDVTTPFRAFNYDVQVCEPLPKEIKDIKSVSIDADINLFFTFEQAQALAGKIYISAGSSVQLPRWVVLGEIPAGFRLEPGNLLIVESPIAVLEAGSILKLPVKGLVFNDRTLLPDQGIKDGQLLIDEDIPMKGNVDVKKEDILKPGNFNAALNAKMSLENVVLHNAVVCVEPDFHMEIPDIALDGIPDIFKNSNVKLDFNTVRLDLEVMNSSPLSTDFSCNVQSFRIGQQEPLSSVGLSGIHIVSGTRENPGYSRYSISETGKDVTEGYTGTAVPDLTDLISSVPDTIQFNDLLFQFSKDPVTVVPEEEYELGINYLVETPLAFGDDMYIEFSSDIENVNIDFSKYDLKTAVLELEAISSVPLDFDLKIEAITKEGVVIPDIDIAVDQKIASGTVAAPTTTAMSLNIVAHEGSVVFDGLRTTIYATSKGGEFSGIALNKEQGLELKKLTFRLPDGITVNKTPEEEGGLLPENGGTDQPVLPENGTEEPAPVVPQK